MKTLLIEALSRLSGNMFLGELSGLTDFHDDLEKFSTLFGLSDGQIKIS